uniref:D-isomer specific 2-hydroxyacid dehydrogenase catalytic domain-containing protein n=1 Tax=Ananas comosus var. bracteatus TaxID=296719 RepID=A0A6V7QLA5_ANACO|nr:unnamed protein product [Ananas comosus var. bracteatus]
MESESEPSPPPPLSFSDADDPPPPPSPELPEVIALSPLLPAFDAALSARFRLLKPSPLPLSSPISSAANAALVRAPTRVDAAVLDLVPSLRLVVTTSAGLDHFDLPECARRGVAVASAGHVFSPTSPTTPSPSSSTSSAASPPRAATSAAASGLSAGTTPSDLR